MENTPKINIPEKAQNLFEKGQQALDNANYDYAIALFEGALNMAPFYTICRQKLRLSQFRKFDFEKPNIIVIYIKLIFNLKPFVAGLLYFHKERWIDAIGEFEKVLLIHPKNKTALGRLAAAAEKNGMTDVAIDTLNALRHVDQKNVSVIKDLARIYKDLGDLNNARDCYEDVLNIAPDDPDAGPELRKIAALGTIKKTSWDRLESFREKIKDEDQAKLFEKEARFKKTDEEIKEIIAATEKKLELSPNNIDIMTTLSELYFQIQDYGKAAEYVNKCIEKNPADFGFKRILAQIEVKSIDCEINKIKEILFDHPDNDKLKTSLEKLQQKRLKVSLADCIAQVEQFPTNLALRYELGIQYMHNGMIDKAISEFQLSVKNPGKKIQSLDYLGQCFKSKKIYDLAVEQFTAAADYLQEMTDLKKDIIYNLASTYEDMGKPDKAAAEYKKIYTIDISYRDVADKIEKRYKDKI